MAVDIGTRPAGSDAEHEAADYIAGELTSYGYQVEMQAFSFQRDSDSDADVRIASEDDRQLVSMPLTGSATGQVEGELVAAGLGSSSEFPANTSGNVALVERGELFFGEKVANAASAGAAAVIIYNNRSGFFVGQLEAPGEIPAVSLSQEDGEELRDLLAGGTVNVRIEVRGVPSTGESFNVIARPPSGDCSLIIGGHYDSVPAGPGANDNASGTGTVMEMARVLAEDGPIDGPCFVLFGSEEIGLLGSAHFVNSMSEAEKDALIAMLNLDMAGVGSQWMLLGSPEMVSHAGSVADDLEIPHVANPSDSGGSDHFHFMQAGIPAVMFHRFVDPNYHTERDRAEFVEKEYLEEVGLLALALIRELLEVNEQDAAEGLLPTGDWVSIRPT